MIASPRSATLLLSLALLACIPAVAQATWPHDPAVNVPVCTAALVQQFPKACPDGSGGAIIAWEDWRGGALDVYVQRIRSDGVPLWTANGVGVCTRTGTQEGVAICADGTGGAILVWEDSRSGNADIYAQRISASGVAQWTADGVAVCTATGAQMRPAICPSASSGFIIAWADFRGANLDIYARRVTLAGTPQWTANGVVLCDATSGQDGVQIVTDDSGGAIATWYDYRSVTSYDLYAQRVNSSGTVQWTADGVVVCNEADDQGPPVIGTDGSGGAFIAWEDGRNGVDDDVYAQRLSPTGTRPWGSGGLALCTSTGDQDNVTMVADGSGGAVVAWTDARAGASNHNIYAQRLQAPGYVLWTANGVGVCAATGDQWYPECVADGTGGALVAWTDRRYGQDHVYARRVDAAGSLKWAANGVPLCTNRYLGTGLALVPDGLGGAVAAWAGCRVLGGEEDVYAQRVDRFGEIGSPEPAIVGVEDVAADQGGQVVVRWTPSYLDAAPDLEIAAYSVWREAPVAAAMAARTASAVGPVGGRALRTTVQGVTTYYWEYVGSVPGRAREAYSLVVPTTTDSMAGSNPHTRLMVTAEQIGGSPFWDSAPDSGYSVDNLAPPMPEPFTGEYVNGSAVLAWGASPAPDFAVFRLHRGATADFVPGPGNLVATTAARGHTDLTPMLHYKLCAVDVHGNASPYAALYLASALDAPEAGPPREVFFAAPVPNPSRSGATFRYGLPGGARVRLLLHDLQGRRVRTLVSGLVPAGEHGLRWDGADDGGRALPAGLYLCRLEVEGRAFTRRLAIVR